MSMKCEDQSLNYYDLCIKGSIRIKPQHSLPYTAGVLANVLGITFREDPSGTYDEFPSWSAEALGLLFSLLGIPDEDSNISGATDYSLEVRLSDRMHSMAEYECDISRYLAKLIRTKSTLIVVE